ncbi:hypothetical protein F5Y11DRAFT_362083 [Daldinia sp. FL1419]|nr:hypothetical protein F5Y11DRAFT_362083 [Daldinia sp. FL1419]
MYVRDEIINAILRLYQQVIRHPYLDEISLLVPPLGGWSLISVQGKTETVLDLLRHLPYLCSRKQYDRLLINWETVPICYIHDEGHHEAYSLPVHCVYLARGVDREGTSLILDTEQATITEYCHTGTYITVSKEEYEALSEADKWKAHRTSPIAEFFDAWTRRYEKLVWMLTPNPIGQPTTGRFYSRAETSAEEDRLLQEDQLKLWRFRDDINPPDSANALDKARYEARIDMRRHVEDVYNTYLRYGWPRHFDKDGCRSQLLRLEKTKDAEDRRKMDDINPDAHLFD